MGPTTKLSSQDRVILFCVATGIHHGSVGIIAHAMQSMAIRGFIAHKDQADQRVSVPAMRREAAAAITTTRPWVAKNTAENKPERSLNTTIG